jgi:hypothetical protein
MPAAPARSPAVSFSSLKTLLTLTQGIPRARFNVLNQALSLAAFQVSGDYLWPVLVIPEAGRGSHLPKLKTFMT